MKRELIIDVGKILKSGLKVEEYFICWSKYYDVDIKEYFDLHSDFSHQSYVNLVNKGWLIAFSRTFTYESVELEEDRFRNVFIGEDSKEWIDKWFDLWPRGVKSGIYYVKSDVNSCRIRMQRFMKRNSRFSEDIVMRATQSYLDRAKIEGYSYIMLAHNFIEKNRASTLAGECENVRDVVVKKDEPSQKSLFDREL
jgi:hypothetical protein